MNGTEFEKRIAVRIDEIRGGKRISQKQLGEAIGVSQAAVSQRLNGQVPFTVSDLKGLADALGVRFIDLLPEETLV